MAEITITRTADYSCTYKESGHLDYHYPTRDITVTTASEATPEAVEQAFQRAAEDAKKLIFGCHNVKFEGFRSTPSPAAVTPPATATPPQEAPKSLLREILESGRWSPRWR